MDLRVLGGCGAWPAAGQACSGYLLEHDGFRLLIDPGYAVLPRLLRDMDAADVDAVLVSHRHPDHCADLNPLLRARALRDDVAPAPALTVFALPGALDAVLALDRPGLLDDAIELHPFEAGATFEVGPLVVDSRLLPHSVPNAGVRLTGGGHTLVYTGDAAPDPALVDLARDADVLLAEASFVDEVPGDDHTLSSARDAGRQAAEAAVGALVLTHLLPGTDRRRSAAAARAEFDGPIRVARPGLRLEVGGLQVG